MGPSTRGRTQMTTLSARTVHGRARHSGDRRIGKGSQGYRYGVVLLLLLVMYVVEVAAPGGSWSRVVTVALEGLVLLVAMGASGTSRSIVRVTSVIVGLVVLAALVIAASGISNDGIRGSFFLTSACLIAAAPGVIVRGLMVRPVIDSRTILGALCIYVLIGMLFSFAYATIGSFSTGPFFAQNVKATVSDFLYFSFVTLTTVGYGDLTAADGLGRAAAVLEALLGQIYLVTVVALLVGTMGQPRRAPASDIPDAPAGGGGT